MRNSISKYLENNSDLREWPRVFLTETNDNYRLTNPYRTNYTLVNNKSYFQILYDSCQHQVEFNKGELEHNQNIRNLIKDTQRSFYDPRIGLIADGRDMGSVVFPKARIKIYLDASIEERAKRRQIQLKEKGMEVNMRNLISSLEDRDLKDKNREVSPLLIPDGAKVIDSTNLSINEVVNKIMDLI